MLRYIQTGKMSRSLTALIHDFAATIHTSEELGDPLAVQAQDGMMALDNTLQLCQEANVELAVDSGLCVIDAVDNFQFVAQMVGEDNWLLSNEMTRQLQQSAQLACQIPDFAQIRIENMQFAIPPAVL